MSCIYFIHNLSIIFSFRGVAWRALQCAILSSCLLFPKQLEIVGVTMKLFLPLSWPHKYLYITIGGVASRFSLSSSSTGVYLSLSWHNILLLLFFTFALCLPFFVPIFQRVLIIIFYAAAATPQNQKEKKTGKECLFLVGGYGERTMEQK